MAGLPEHLLRRSAEARAKAEGRDVEEVLAELKGEAPASAAADAPAAPAAAAAASTDSTRDLDAEAAATGVPVELLQRAMDARAQHGGTPAPATAASAPPVAEPVIPAATPTPAPAAAAAASTDSTRDLDAEAAATGVPVELLQRAMEARARRDGKPVPAMAGAPAAVAAPAAAPAAAQPAAAQPATAPPAPTAPPAIPEGVTTQRLLTVVKAGAIQQVKSSPQDKVSTWPHLLAIEFVALMVVTAGLIIFSVFVDAPLLEFANFNEQPNPSKAPWYFLGLQELLSYFDPQVAGVIIPGFGLGALAIIPYIDKNPSVKPSDRKLAIMIFSFFLFAAAVLTIYGSFFRGPGFNFSFPWVDGIFFDF
ncbi:MAG: hypothetical protein U9N84_12880 [Actinomycetota bacterium]|nr:hypothetical protein [Actinomycetota bacterium]